MQRVFTTTEEADISCHASALSGWVFCEEDYAINQQGDKLHAIADNLYQITRAKDGKQICFVSLARAMERL